MSTEFTRKSPKAHFDLVDSHSLKMTLAMDKFQGRIINWLLQALSDKGFDELTASQLGFLGALDCGPNHAAKLARDLRITRQAVHKTVRELEKIGLLVTEPDEQYKNQRVINFTIEGERMMAEARNLFATLDQTLIDKYGEENLLTLSHILDFNPLEKED